MNPLVTIITPAYNRADYLAATIESVLAQDYAPLEYIVLDDGSQDHTREVLARYSGRIIWDSHPNMGETRTVNKGWQQARGEFVAVVNSDDPLLAGAVQTAVDFMIAHPEVLVAYPDWDKIGPRGELIERVQVPEYNYRYMLTRHHCIVGPGAFIRRRAFELAGLRDPEFRYVADFEYWLRLGLYGPFARIPASLATFRVHSQSASVSHAGRAMAAEHIRLMRKYYARPDLPAEVRQVRAEAWGWAHHVAAEMCGRDRFAAALHYLKAVWCHPPILWVLGRNQLLRALKRLPPPLYALLRWSGRRAQAAGRQLAHAVRPRQDI